MIVTRDIVFMKRPLKDNEGTGWHSNKNWRQWPNGCCCGDLLFGDSHPLSKVLLQKRLVQEVVLSWVFSIKNIELCDFYIRMAPLGHTGNPQPPSRQMLATWVVKSQGMGPASRKVGEEIMDRL